MSRFQRLVIRALGILMRMQMSPGRLPDETAEAWAARGSEAWKTETYPKIMAWESEANSALEEDGG